MHGRGGPNFRRAGRRDLAEAVRREPAERRGGAVAAGNHRGAQIGETVEDRLDCLRQVCGNHHRFRATVLEHVGVLLGRQHGVERHRDDAGADRAPERDREIHRVEHQQHDAVLRPQPECLQAASEPAGRCLQLGISQCALRVGEDGFLGKPALDVRVDEIADRVVPTSRPG